MPELTYRTVNEDDLPILCSFLQTPEELSLVLPKATFPLTPASLKETCAKATESIVVCYRGEAVGFSNLFVGQEPGLCSISHFFVAPGFRRKGIGRYLVMVMTAQARRRYKAIEIWLSCFASNTWALILYERAGFHPVSMKTIRKPKRDPTVLLYLRLSFQNQQPIQATPPETLIFEQG